MKGVAACPDRPPRLDYWGPVLKGETEDSSTEV